MYSIVASKKYVRSYRKYLRSGVKKQTLDELQLVIDTLAEGKKLNRHAQLFK
ncbi:hypothetical protein KTR10_00635 [Candidatus Kaiserbacteria bacterium]|nr:hypothetical protein [Candidatus Kaiserbacteria bacterium]